MSDLRTIEAKSIRDFVEQAGIDGYLKGRVLDYGCGKQPYRSLVESFGAEYVGYDAPTFPASCADEDTTLQAWHEEFDTILCTQVVQYVPDVARFLFESKRYRQHSDAAPPGVIYREPNLPPLTLVLTWPICWPLVESEDLHRFTVSGMERLLTYAGFTILCCEVRAEYNDFPIGGQAVARA